MDEKFFGITMTPVTAILGALISIAILKIFIKIAKSVIIKDVIRFKHFYSKALIGLDCLMITVGAGFALWYFFHIPKFYIFIACWIIFGSIYILFMTKETQKILYIIFGFVWGYFFYCILMSPSGIIGEMLIKRNININCLAYEAIVSGFFVYINIRSHFFFRETDDYTQYSLFKKKKKNQSLQDIPDDVDIPDDIDISTPQYM